jgi:very-short-patch-repair endonuclease
MHNDTHLRLGERAARRHGVFTLRDAKDLGIPDRSVRNRSAVGRYRRVEPGVYAFVGSPESQLREIAAAVLSFPDLAAASHQTAAELWGLTRRGIRTPEVVTTRWDRVHRPGLRVHESLDLLPEDVMERNAIPITSPVRTVVDLGASNKWVVEAALEEGVRRGLFGLRDVEEFVARVGRRGRRGVGVIRPLLRARRRWDKVTESALEDRFRKLVTEAGLPDPKPQFEVRDVHDGFVCRADFAYPAARVLIELDSEAHHLDRLAFRRDRSKQNRAVVLGWTVLRYTWWDLSDRPYDVAAEVRSLLAGAG